MLKQPAGVVLAALRGSPYRRVRLAFSLAAALPGSLFEHSRVINVVRLLFVVVFRPKFRNMLFLNLDLGIVGNLQSDRLFPEIRDGPPEA